MTAATSKRPQLTLDELHQLRWLLGGILALLAVSTVFYMDVAAWTVSGITMLAAIVTLARPTLPGRLPALVHTLAFPAIVAFFVVDLWLMAEVLPAMVRLDILLLLYRCITYRQRRDDLQIIVLGLFLIVVAGVLTVSLTFAAHILVYTGTALAMLLVITLSDATGKLPQAKGQTPAAAGTPAWARHTDWRSLFRRLRQVTDWRVVGLGAVLFVGVVGVSAVLFLAIPRFQIENSMFLDRLISKKARSGFTDRIQFGDVTAIAQDHSVALSVDVSDHSQIPAMPYWRMMVLDRYDNQTFRMSQGLRSSAFERERFAPEIVGHATPRRGATFWRFYLESGVSRYLPLIGRFERLRFREAQTFSLSPGLTLVQLRQEPVSMLAYQVEDFETAAALPDPDYAKFLAELRKSGGVNAQLTRGVLEGSDHGRLARIVGEITGGRSVTAPEFARLAGEWLRRQHQYSLAPTIPEGAGDPLVRWVDSRQGGHCELFAGSLVLLARNAGFPARMVTGFKGGTWNAYSNNFTIRNSDAHAWTEIFDEAAGAWLRADPLDATSGTESGSEATGEAAVNARMDRSWNARLESLRVFWYRRIVSFDQRSQTETLKAVKEATQNSGRRLRESFVKAAESFKAWLTSPWDLRRIGGVATALGALAAAVWLWRGFGRTWWRAMKARRDPRREDPVRREAGRWLARLAANGVAETDGRVVIAELQRVRFGARATWGEPEKIFRRARHALREARRRGRVTRF